jgi:hypothetical protein
VKIDNGKWCCLLRRLLLTQSEPQLIIGPAVDSFIGNGWVRVPQSPFSPDRAWLDFYLYAKVKVNSMERILNDEGEVFESVMEVLRRIRHDELETIFEEWLAQFNTSIWQIENYVE